MSGFVPSDAEVRRLVRDYPLAWLVSWRPGWAATPLPLLAEPGEGRISSFLGHLALRNPQVAMLRTEPETLVLFQGPQGYVSPNLVSNRDWAPTWNYAVARFETRVQLLPDMGDEALARLVETMEQGQAEPWTRAEMGARYDALSTRIIAFRAHVRVASATFKLGQDERPEVLAEIVGGHPDPVLAQWMQRANEPGGAGPNPHQSGL